MIITEVKLNALEEFLGCNFHEVFNNNNTENDIIVIESSGLRVGGYESPVLSCKSPNFSESQFSEVHRIPLRSLLILKGCEFELMAPFSSR